MRLTRSGRCISAPDGSATDVDYRAEFERQQFLLYEARRVASETHANAVIAAALAIAAVLIGDYSRRGHPSLAWFVIGVGGVAWVLVFANVARTVSFPTPRWRGGRKWEPEPPSDVVDKTLRAMRRKGLHGVVLREGAHRHWQARAVSAYQLGLLKSQRLNLALMGVLGPAAYFAARTIS